MSADEDRPASPQPTSAREDGAGPEKQDRLWERYRWERDRRMRPEATGQYRQAGGALGDTRSGLGGQTSRAARFDEVDVVVIGAGFGGLIMASHLRAAGIHNFLIVDNGADFGGTWFWNHYPGAACDIESYIYMPLLEETGYMPSLKYAYRAEIYEQCRRIGRHLDLYRQTLFRTGVRKLDWDTGSSRWNVWTDRGDTIRARFVCSFTGPFSSPKIPAIAGFEDFRGRAFHTSRWNYDYTGGDSTGNLAGLRDKHVGLIGTGATAVQCMPHLAEGAGQLYVFQRTPSSVDARNNRPTDRDWARSLRRGWQQRRMENFNNVVLGLPVGEDMVDDGWTHLVGRGIGLEGAAAEEHQLANFAKMEKIRKRIDLIVTDPATAEALKPYYNEMCKRPCFHDSYLQSFNRDNVTLVDTQAKGVERFTESGIVAAGREYRLDCMVFATGFEWQNDLEARSGYEVRGCGGARLADRWKVGLSSLFGVHMSDFPNLLVMTTSQQVSTANYTHALNEIARHNAYVIETCLRRGIDAVEPTLQAERDWVDHIMSFAEARRKFAEDCIPGFYNNEGAVSTISLRNDIYGGSSPDYFRMLADWRAEGTMRGLATIKQSRKAA